MWCPIIAIFLVFQLAAALWGTFYNFAEGKVYVVLKNNDMVALNFSITGFSDLTQYSTYTLDEIDLKNNQDVSTLSLPPANSSLFLHDSTLYAFSSSDQDSDYDLCGDGVFQLSKYDPQQDSWTSAADNMTFSDVDDVSFYAGSSYFASDRSSTIYIYGGQCASTGDVTNRMLSFDMDTKTFANITTSTKPQGFYGGLSLWAPNPQNSLVFGGRAASGWLSMSQLATWNFQSGWLFELTEQNGTESIASRTYPLVLPVFSPLSDNSTSTFTNDYKVSSVIMAGGDLSGNSDESAWLQLSLASNQWTWSIMDNDFDSSDVLGAATIFNTLVVVNASTSTQKRDGLTSYLVSLYDVSDLLSAVSDLKSNTQTELSQLSSSGGTSKTTTIVVATLVPLAALSILVTLGFWLWKRRAASDNHSELHTVDYPLGHFRAVLDQSYDPLRPTHLSVYRNPNDLASTLDVGSIDLWFRKRQEYDAKRLRTFKRHSFLASNETLNGHLVGELPEVSDERFGERIRERYGDKVGDNENARASSDGNRNSSEEFGEDFAVDFEYALELEPETPTAAPTATPTTEAAPKAAPTSNAAKPKLPRINQLRKSFSYSYTPPQLPLLRKTTRLDPGFLDLANLAMSEENIDLDLCDEDMDVQVLVSSKRKSVLRVMNPDAALQVSEEIRQRTPS